MALIVRLGAGPLIDQPKMSTSVVELILCPILVLRHEHERSPPRNFSNRCGDDVHGGDGSVRGHDHGYASRLHGCGYGPGETQTVCTCWHVFRLNNICTYGPPSRPLEHIFK